ncbi:MAG: hypothetical protein P4L44_16595 [Oryzomonas sp.]|uniref:hypothetical protein n=1 Tax=Oryzomonas sp. TaxID=2855186 RepID=UPI002845DAD0|nr:hypothetical protein [Oryzomonas sp.]MDR3581582.1 hypothetical protein [Oryzomonas sp.]
MTNQTLTPEYLNHAEALEGLKQALTVAEPTSAPIPFDVAARAYVALAFAFQEWQEVENTATLQIEQLRAELFRATAARGQA